ncbi:TPA: metal-dependent hydrolase [Candidatus Woesearchaeota archaeon]|nr:hypothetical protein [archaeon]HIJ10716.1 metal-dependent hydrolase [Candidatus Woesearchaeota archaeon]|tara:strand:- start:8 stop:463 length:456 start_codon:yes stop_codon:yes gene_type:complete
MLFPTHILLGIVLYLISRPFFSGGNEIVFFLLVLLGAILPDIDEPRSKISQWTGIIGKIVGRIAKHRGFCHSIFFVGIISFAIAYVWSSYYAWALFMGYVAHMIGDGITPMGVRIFYPFSKARIKGPFRTGGLSEKVIMVLLILVIVKQFV